MGISQAEMTLEQKKERFTKIPNRPLVMGNLMLYLSEAKVMLVDHYSK